MRNNVKSVALLVIGLALFAALVALTIDVVKEAFSPPGEPLLKAEPFRTSDTPFSGWTVSRVAALIVVAIAVMSVPEPLRDPRLKDRSRKVITT